MVLEDRLLKGTELDLVNEDDPRFAFDRSLIELAKADPRVYGLSADMSSVLKGFVKTLPERYFDFGIAEQNMVGAAAGLALQGIIPFATTMSCFLSMRVFEQARTDIAYTKANVKLVGFSAGTSYGVLASTHHATEDIALYRSVPNMTILSPAGPVETARAIKAAAAVDGPIYIRIGRGPEPVVYAGADYRFEIGKGIIMRRGTDATIFATGYMVAPSLGAAEILTRAGLDVMVVNIHTIKPLDAPLVIEASKGARVVFTVEDHNTIGGLGSAVAEVLAEKGMGPLIRLGIPDVFAPVGTQDQILTHYGCDAAGIAETVRKSLG